MRTKFFSLKCMSLKNYMLNIVSRFSSQVVQCSGFCMSGCIYVQFYVHHISTDVEVCRTVNGIIGIYNI